ncbi:MAG: phosphoribosylanthranilate isomerase [Granulosicoccus sp.]
MPRIFKAQNLPMKIKVCGMRNPDNLQELLDLPIDYVGLIFYKKSKRFVEKELPKIDFQGKEKVGVFVNESLEYIVGKSQQYDFITVQLHGSESPDFCEKLKEKNFKIIKAFSVDGEFDFSKTKKYEPFCDYFLFDTKGKLPGGNGYTFDWKVLENYQGETPFFLSGGIDSRHNNILKKLNIKQLHAIDLNSGFEIEPALKDILLLKKFIEDVRN